MKASIFLLILLSTVVVGTCLAPTSTASSISLPSTGSFAWISVQPSTFIPYKGEVITLVQVTILINGSSHEHPGISLTGGNGPPTWVNGSDGWTMTQFAVVLMNNTGGWFPFDQYYGSIYVLTNTTFPGSTLVDQAPTRDGITPIGSNYYSSTSVTETNASSTYVDGHLIASEFPIHSLYVLTLTTTVSHLPEFWTGVFAIDFGVVAGLSALVVSMAWLLKGDFQKMKRKEVADFPGGLLTSLVVSTLVFIPLFWFSTRSFEAPLSYTWVDVSLGGLMVAEILLAIVAVALRSGSPSKKSFAELGSFAKSVFWTRMGYWVASLLVLVGLFPLPYRLESPWVLVAVEDVFAPAPLYVPFWTQVAYIAPLMLLLFFSSFMMLVPIRRAGVARGIVLVALGAIASFLFAPNVPTFYQYWGRDFLLAYGLTGPYSVYLGLLWLSILGIWMKGLSPEVARVVTGITRRHATRVVANSIRARWRSLVVLALALLVLWYSLLIGVYDNQTTYWVIPSAGIVLVYVVLRLGSSLRRG